MKKKGFSKLITWLFVFIFVAGVTMPLASDARAEGNPQEIPGVSYYIPDETLVYLNSPAQYSLSYEGASLKDITKLKSSNKNVATVEKSIRGENITLEITPKKAGNTTISFTFKHEKKTYRFKMKIAVKKYVNPFKSFKIGSERFEQYLDSAHHTEAINAHVPLKETLKKKKLAFQLKQGWELQTAFMSHNGKWKDIESGKKITVSKGDEIDFWIKDPKGYAIWFYFFFD